MVDQNTIEMALKIEADEAAARKTQARVDKVIKGLEKLKKEQSSAAGQKAIQEQIDLYKKEGFEIERNNELLEEQTKINEKQKRLLEKRIQQRGKQVPGDEAFSQVSREVALAGDVETNLRTIGGAIGTLGGESGRAVEGIVLLASEFPAIVEAGPRLAASLKGFPAAMKAAAAATLGLETATTADTAAKAVNTTATTGATVSILGMNVALWQLAAVGIAIGAVIAVATSVLHGQEQANKELAEQVRRNVELDRELLEAKSMTSSAIEDELAEIDRQLQLENELLDKRKQENQALQDAADSMGVGFEFAALLTNAEAPLKAANEELQTQQDVVTDLTDRQKVLTEALESQEVAARDATEALLEEVDKIGELENFRNQAFKANGDALQEMGDALQEEENTLRKQIAVIEESGDTSKEAQERLAGLNKQLELNQEKVAILGEEEVILNARRKDSAEAAEEAAKEEEKLAKEREAAAKKTAQALEKQEADINKFITDAIGGDDIQEALAEEQEKRLEFIEKSGEEELKAREDFENKKRDLARDQSFLALIDEIDDFSDERKQKAKERRKGLEELNKELAEERAVKVANAQAEQVERMMELQANAQAVADAKAEEERLVRSSQETQMQLQQSRYERETQIYNNLGMMVEQFGQRVQGALGGLDIGGLGGGAMGGFGAASNPLQQAQDMLNQQLAAIMG